MTASIDSSIGKTKVVLAHNRMVIAALALKGERESKTKKFWTDLQNQNLVIYQGQWDLPIYSSTGLVCSALSIILEMIFVHQ
jgi:hypothetical protein